MLRYIFLIEHTIHVIFDFPGCWSFVWNFFYHVSQYATHLTTTSIWYQYVLHQWRILNKLQEERGFIRLNRYKSWIDWLVFNAIFSSISAISWRYKSKWISTEPMGTEIESNFSAVVQNISLESSVNKACGQQQRNLILFLFPSVP